MAIVASFSSQPQQGISLVPQAPKPVATFSGSGTLQGSAPALQGSSPYLQGSSPNLNQAPTPKRSLGNVPPISLETQVSSAGAGTGQALGILDQSAALARQQQQAEAQLLEQNKQELLRQYEQAAGLATSRTNLSIADIERALSGATSQLESSKGQVLDETAKAQIDLAQGLARQFGARGATDSTFYANALAKGQADLSKNQINELNKVNMAISQAQQQAQSQKSQLQQMLSEKLLELQQTKSQFVFEQAKAIQESIFNLDNYLLQIDQKKADVAARLSSGYSSSGRQKTLQDILSQNLDQFATEGDYIQVPGGRDQLLQYYTSQYGNPDQALQRIQQVEGYVANQKAQQADPLALLLGQGA